MPDTPAPPQDKHQIQVIARAAAILRALQDEPDGLSLGQIAARVGLPRSTVQRIVGALEGEGLLAPAIPGGRMRLGPALLRLAASVETDVAALARPPFVTSLQRDGAGPDDGRIIATDVGIAGVPLERFPDGWKPL
ncbi:MAG: helix-turn-helix domain-containing protein [Acetobacteraceae bacterium]